MYFFYRSTPIRPILKNTRFTIPDETEPEINIIKTEIKSPGSIRKVITTTVTEEYLRIKRKQIIEELEEGILVDKILL